MWSKLTRYRSYLVVGRNLTSNVMSSIKTFVFIDLETTGLPYQEHNKTKMTELCAVAVQADHIELGCFPRVHNKLALCFNPMRMINPQSTDLTGLSNELLENQAGFSSETVEVLSRWLDLNRRPICLVAHNGDRFDYPILRAEVDKTGENLPEDLLCLDSLQAFRELDNPPLEEAPPVEEPPSKLTPEEVQKINETTPKKQQIGVVVPTNGTSRTSLSFHRNCQSYKLQDVYKRLTSKTPTNCHEAEGDIVMLITCAAVYGEKFVAYANAKSKKFADVPAMKPGRKIGT